MTSPDTPQDGGTETTDTLAVLQQLGPLSPDQRAHIALDLSVLELWIQANPQLLALPTEDILQKYVLWLEGYRP